MSYQPIADLTQFQSLEALLRALLHGALAALIGAVVMFLFVYLCQRWLQTQPAPEARQPAAGESGDPLPGPRTPAFPPDRIPLPLWEMIINLSAGCFSAQIVPALWLDWHEFMD